MSKFKRLTLTEFPLKDEEARRKLKGGSTMCDAYPVQVILEADDHKRMDPMEPGREVLFLG